MKLNKKSGIYTNSTRTNKFDPEKCTAHSYDWWQYLGRIRGQVVFNVYHYSSSTSKHQAETRSLMHGIGMRIDLVVSVPNGLQCFASDALRPLYREVFKLETEIARRGSRTSTNAERARRIAQLRETIRKCRALGAVCSRTEQATIKRQVQAAEIIRVARRIAFDRVAGEAAV